MRSLRLPISALLLSCTLGFPLTSLAKDKGISAGIIAYACSGQSAYVLLAYDPEGDRKAWGSFGGSAKSGETVEETASREFHEETRCVYPGPSPRELAGKPTASWGRFESYVVRVPFVPASVIEKAPCYAKQERRDWIWVSLEDLVQALEAPVSSGHREVRALFAKKRYKLWDRSVKVMQDALSKGLLPKNSSMCADS